MVLPEIDIRSWKRASDDERRSGLIAYLTLLIGPVVVDGVTLRRFSSGQFGLSFPARVKASGQRFSIVWPADNERRLALEREVLRQLAERQDLGGAREDLP